MISLILTLGLITRAKQLELDMTKFELHTYQWLRRTRHFKPLFYGLVLVGVSFVVSILSIIFIILWLCL